MRYEINASVWDLKLIPFFRSENPRQFCIAKKSCRVVSMSPLFLALKCILVMTVFVFSAPPCSIIWIPWHIPEDSCGKSADYRVWFQLFSLLSMALTAEVHSRQKNNNRERIMFLLAIAPITWILVTFWFSINLFSKAIRVGPATYIGVSIFPYHLF